MHYQKQVKIKRTKNYDHLIRLQAPDGAGRVNGGSAQQVRIHLVPVEGGERGAEVRVLVVVEKALQLGLRLPGPPDPEVVPAGGQQVRVDPLAVRDPHDLGGGVGVVERALGREFRGLLVQGHDLNR